MWIHSTLDVYRNVATSGKTDFNPMNWNQLRWICLGNNAKDNHRGVMLKFGLLLLGKWKEGAAYIPPRAPLWNVEYNFNKQIKQDGLRSFSILQYI